MFMVHVINSTQLQIGGFILTECKKLQKKHCIIGDVRGKGLFVGIELVQDRSSLTPAPQQVGVSLLD